MPTDAQSLINAAYAAGYAKLSERALNEVAAYATAAGGGGGGGTLGGNGSPVGVVTPTSQFAVYIQADSVPNPGVIWEWYGGAWH